MRWQRMCVDRTNVFSTVCRLLYAEFLNEQILTNVLHIEFTLMLD